MSNFNPTQLSSSHLDRTLQRSHSRSGKKVLKLEEMVQIKTINKFSKLCIHCPTLTVQRVNLIRYSKSRTILRKINYDSTLILPNGRNKQRRTPVLFVSVKFTLILQTIPVLLRLMSKITFYFRLALTIFF